MSRPSHRQASGRPASGAPRVPARAVAVRTLLAAAATAALMAAGPADADAQVAAAFELRPGGSVGRYDVARGGMDSSPQLAWRAGATISPRPLIHLVASYGRSAFGCQGGFCEGTDVGFVSSGGELGLRLGAAGARPGPWVQGDLIAHSVRATWPDGDQDSDRAVGWGAAIGFHLPVAPRLAVSPALRVQTYAAALPPDPEPYRVSMASAELGLRLRLR